jgi:hypothetical protein
VASNCSLTDFRIKKMNPEDPMTAGIKTKSVDSRRSREYFQPRGVFVNVATAAAPNKMPKSVRIPQMISIETLPQF